MRYTFFFVLRSFHLILFASYVLMLSCIYDFVFHCKLHWHLRILTMNEAPFCMFWIFSFTESDKENKKTRMQHKITITTAQMQQNCFKLKLNLCCDDVMRNAHHSNVFRDCYFEIKCGTNMYIVFIFLGNVIRTKMCVCAVQRANCTQCNEYENL